MASWCGITRSEDLHSVDRSLRIKIADAAKSYNWPELIDLLDGNTALVNCWRPGGHSFFSPLHQAAHGGAPAGVVRHLIDQGAWRNLCNAFGERPVDIAEAKGNTHLVDMLQPILLHNVPPGILSRLQDHFHCLIKERAGKLVGERHLRLPELSPLLEMEKPAMWFPVPGMYGGFNFLLEGEGSSAKLISDSWCRVCEGSEQRHVITSRGFSLVKD